MTTAPKPNPLPSPRPVSADKPSRSPAVDHPSRIAPTNAQRSLAGHIQARLRATGHTATVVKAPGLKPGHCRACDTNTTHPACVVVDVALTTEWTEPATWLDGWTTPCCWAGLTAYLTEAEHVECLAGITVEVPA